MNRRDFLRNALASGAIYSAGGLPLLSESAEAGFAAVRHRVLAGVTLAGGPDFRHLLPPAFSTNTSSYGNRFWRARAGSFGLGNSSQAMAKHWNSAFYHRGSGGQSFGILKKAVWLKDMWDAGNVAIVNNVIGSESRDHSHGLLVMDQGIRSSGPNDFNRSGWGGRLALAANGNVVSTSYAPRPFCYPPHENGDIYRVGSNGMISTPDTRDLDLWTPDSDYPQWDERGKVARALRSYYLSLRQDLDRESIFYDFVEHEKNVRRFGAQIKQRLRTVRQPAALKALARWDNNVMKNPGFAQQMSSLYDALACSDILQMRVASLDYGGWDTHDDQRNMIEPNIVDLFGRNRSFDTFWKALPSQAKNKLVFVIFGEFGRQLNANGSGGTDHGRGNSVLLIGKPVRGGIYGDMFPNRELARLNEPSPDIDGRTDIDQVFGACCNWTSAGSRGTVFPEFASSKRESGVSFARLFS